jgi:transcription termination factor Rho
MSVGSQALERSTLEAKDRESLHQIATAMGGKPGSRAKKADIITMILELAGVTDTAAPAEAPDRGAAEAQLPLGGEPTTDTGSEGSAQEPAAAESEASAAPAPTPAADAPSTNGNGHAATTADEEADATPAAEGERNGGGGARTEDNRSAQAAQPQGRSDESEQTSRRRRRRGRDRDRQGQAGGSPQPAASDDFLGEPVEVVGLLDLRDEGYGFLRVKAYLPSKEDVYVSVKQVRQFGLRKGDQLKGAARPASRNEKNPALLRIDEVNGKEPELNKARSRFEDLTALAPAEPFRLGREAGDEGEGPASDDLTARILDLVAPIGRGQRGLIVSAPKAGRTEILKAITTLIEAGNSDAHLMVLLIDERPEEVTELRRATSGEVIASTFDRPADEHLMVAELAIERAKRLVEEGRDVVVLLDGLTRLARAYHLAAPATGRMVAGTVDAAGLTAPKRLFGAARRVEEGGSLTILATAQVDTGAAADDIVVEELRAAANLELVLDRDLADRRRFPAIDVVASATRQEAEFVEPDQVPALWHLRRQLAAAADEGGTAAAYELLLGRLAGTATNDELLAQLAGEVD